MSKLSPSPILQLIRQVAQDPRDRESSDRELVSRFRSDGDEAAFHALLRRHGPMVLGVCRSMLRNEADAEDAFQAAFLVLAHKAGAIRRHDSVGSWLHGVAYRTALKAQAEFARRRKHEERASVGAKQPAADELSWRDVQHVVHLELNRFSERYRAPLVLCYLEGRSQDEAATLLGISRAALKKRLERGRALLRARLLGRGLGSVAALLASAWPVASGIVSPSLASVTMAAALRIAAGQPAGMVSTPVAALAAGVLKMMFVTKLKGVMAALVAVMAIGGTALCVTLAQGPEVGADPSLVATAPAEPSQAKDPPPRKLAPRAEDNAVIAMAHELRAEAVNHLTAAMKKLEESPDVPQRLRHRTFMDMAVLQAKLGDRAGARKTFKVARDIIEQSQGGDGEKRMLARAFAQAGEVDDAMALTTSISGDEGRGGGAGGWRDTTYQEVATELAKAGLEKEALVAAELIATKETKDWVKPMVLREVMLHQARKGNVEQALQSLERIPDPRQRTQLLTGVAYFNYSFTELPHEPGIVQLQAQQRDRAGALKTLARAVELAAKVEEKPDATLVGLACVQARLGELAAAQKTVAGIKHAIGKTIAVAAIGRGQIRAGRPKDAQATIDGIADKGEKVHVVMHVAMEQSKMGDRAGSLKSFKVCDDLFQAMDEKERILHRHNLISARAVAGDFRGARETVAAFGGDLTVANANIAHSQAQAGDIQGALETANSFKEDAWWRGRALRGIAGAQVERSALKDVLGNTKEALQWIRKLPSDLDQADALLGLAEGLLKWSESSGQKR